MATDSGKIKKAVEELADSPAIWETDLSLKTFRKKLKSTGLLMADYVSEVDKFLKEEIAKALKKVDDAVASLKGDLKSGLSGISATVDKKTSESNSKVSSLSERIDDIENDISEIFDDIARIDKNCKTLYSNDLALADAIKKIDAKVNIKITNIDGGK